ncbi:MAG TPA: hypothetical protein VH183_00405 [Burkholderiaceae bacterium]|nr:hypothetical protein [Burkholderiaceae bacterium]
MLLAALLTLTACWTAPTAHVQPKGDPRLIQDGIVVESVKDPATVRSVDVGTRTLVVRSAADSAEIAYKVDPGVSNLARIKAGDRVQATVAEELTVYVAKNARVPGAGAPETANARVLMVDPSYRLLTLQYPDGQSETFKVGLDVELPQMEAGDEVAIRTVEAVNLKVLTR